MVPGPEAAEWAYVSVFSPGWIGCPHRSHILGCSPYRGVVGPWRVEAALNVYRRRVRPEEVGVFAVSPTSQPGPGIAGWCPRAAPQSGTGRLTGFLAATVTAVVPLLPALVALAPAVLFVDTAHL